MYLSASEDKTVDFSSFHFVICVRHKDKDWDHKQPITTTVFTCKSFVLDIKFK